MRGQEGETWAVGEGARPPRRPSRSLSSDRPSSYLVPQAEIEAHESTHDDDLKLYIYRGTVTSRAQLQAGRSVGG